jgi:hypothetical protein
MKGSIFLSPFSEILVGALMPGMQAWKPSVITEQKLVSSVRFNDQYDLFKVQYSSVN